MGRDAAKACENQCFRCRKEAAKYNKKLDSREGAAEMLGISVSSLADYELGNTKVIPVDKVVLMADIGNIMTASSLSSQPVGWEWMLSRSRSRWSRMKKTPRWMAGLSALPAANT